MVHYRLVRFQLRNNKDKVGFLVHQFYDKLQV